MEWLAIALVALALGIWIGRESRNDRPSAMADSIDAVRSASFDSSDSYWR